MALHHPCADHIFEKVNPEMEKLGYECKCLGGGKIEHNSKDKKIRVFGLSTVSAFLLSLSLVLWDSWLIMVAFGNLHHILNINWKSCLAHF